MKQTAVEWLEEQFSSKSMVTKSLFEQAKKIQKQQQGYSKEEVKSFLNSIISEIGLRKENIEKNQEKMPSHLLEGGLMAFESSINVIKESFEQFKNK